MRFVLPLVLLSMAACNTPSNIRNTAEEQARTWADDMGYVGDVAPIVNCSGSDPDKDGDARCTLRLVTPDGDKMLSVDCRYQSPFQLFRQVGCNINPMSAVGAQVE
jgi:hypothetical protein